MQLFFLNDRLFIDKQNAWVKQLQKRRLIGWFIVSYDSANKQ